MRMANLSTELEHSRSYLPIHSVKTDVRPMVELGFMPEALSTKPEPYRHSFPAGPAFTGWSYPPNDYNKWSDLIFAVVRHLADRYGAAQVANWYFEVWNEANGAYWHGTPEEYYKLYAATFTAEAVRRALSTQASSRRTRNHPARQPAGSRLPPELPGTLCARPECGYRWSGARRLISFPSTPRVSPGS